MSDESVLCRACLQCCDKENHGITELCDELGKTYQILFENISGHLIEENEPQNFCMECGLLLYRTAKFKAMISSTQLMLDQIKTEEEEEDVKLEGEIDYVDEEEDDVKDELEEEHLIDTSDHQYFEEVVPGGVETKVKYVDNFCIEEMDVVRDVQIEEVVKAEGSDFDVIMREDDVLLQEEIVVGDSDIPVMYQSVRFQCSICEHEFESERWLEEHLHQVHGMERTHKCGYCEKFFFTTVDRDEHENQCPKGMRLSEPKVQCPECGKVGTKSSIRSHIYHKHKKSRKAQYRCAHCPKVVCSKQSLIKHIQCLHLDYRYHCEFCSKTYSSLSGLNLHKAQHHKNALFTCDQCSFSTPTRAIMRKHQTQHEQVNRYVCSYENCYKKYPTIESLKRHLHVHRDNRPWSCTKCFETFKTQTALSKHSAIAHPEYKYGCSQCDDRFLTYLSLRRHVEADHKSAPLQPSLRPTNGS